MPKEYLCKVNQNLNIDSIFGFIDATISIGDQNIISPIIAIYNGKLCDVTGTIRIVLFSEELKFILKNSGVLISIHTILQYDKGKPLQSFAEDLYSERLSAKDLVLNFIYKLILTASYGRFSIQDAQTRIQIISNDLQSELNSNFEVANSTELTSDFSLCTLFSSF